MGESRSARIGFEFYTVPSLKLVGIGLKDLGLCKETLLFCKVF